LNNENEPEAVKRSKARLSTTKSWERSANDDNQPEGVRSVESSAQAIASYKWRVMKITGGRAIGRRSEAQSEVTRELAVS
jgi:hypothetical protein